MYFKVALLIIASILISGCSNPFSSAKPKKPKKKPPVEVIEEVEETNNNIQVADAAVVNDKPSKPKEVVIKPEPFSIESDEEDPELLGPQSMMKDKLKQIDKKEETLNTSNKEEAKKEAEKEIKKEVSKEIKKENKEEKL
jgi:PBP1b-binding outer membrane lipoprotein LpoB